MTIEEMVKEMTGLGGPYADPTAGRARFDPAKFLGHTIDGES
jgi:hypothetical protein